MNKKIIQVPKETKILTKDSFYACKKLQDITLPENIYLEKGVFGGCPKNAVKLSEAQKAKLIESFLYKSL